MKGVILGHAAIDHQFRNPKAKTQLEIQFCHHLSDTQL
jgi:hypothetical protein